MNLSISKITYIYRITNNINGHDYIGQRYCPSNHTPQSDYYMGGGTAIRRAIKKYGKENFTKEIIVEGELSQEDLDRLEIFYINGLDPYYNIARGGQGGGSLGCKHTEETKKKLSEIAKNRKVPSRTGAVLSEETKERIRQAHTGLKQSEATVNKRIEKCRGRKRSEEAKKKIGNALKGKPKSDETKQKMSGVAKERFKDKTNHPAYGKKSTRRKQLLDVSTGIIYDSITEAMNILGIYPKPMYKRIEQGMFERI